MLCKTTFPHSKFRKVPILPYDFTIFLLGFPVFCRDFLLIAAIFCGFLNLLMRRTGRGKMKKIFIIPKYHRRPRSSRVRRRIDFEGFIRSSYLCHDLVVGTHCNQDTKHQASVFTNRGMLKSSMEELGDAHNLFPNSESPTKVYRRRSRTLHVSVLPMENRQGFTLVPLHYEKDLHSLEPASKVKGIRVVPLTTEMGMHKSHLEQYNLPYCEHTSNSIKEMDTMPESGQEMEFPDACAKWNNDQHMSGHSGSHSSEELFPSTPVEIMSQMTESSSSQMSPGTVIWAKTAHNIWWPAEIMENNGAVESTCNCLSERHVSVKFYGNHELVWLDPSEDVSPFNDFFVQRSSNPTEAFQEALREALLKLEIHSCSDQSSRTPELKGSTFSEDSYDKCNPSTSSKTEDSCLDSGRGKRKRKPKIHFDEIKTPTKPLKKVRRLRIMRYLGLIAPIGSPFSNLTQESMEGRIFGV